MAEMSERGEFVTAEALADPASATLYTWSPEGHLASDGPYAETKEHLAGFFLIDVASRERAEEWRRSSPSPAARSSCDRRCGPVPRTEMLGRRVPHVSSRDR